MRVCRDLLESVDGHAWAVDPDELERALKGAGYRPGVWHHYVRIDAEEKEKARRRQKVVLARYLRQSVLQWDDVEVTEIDRYVQELDALLQRESDAARRTENR